MKKILMLIILCIAVMSLAENARALEYEFDEFRITLPESFIVFTKSDSNEDHPLASVIDISQIADLFENTPELRLDAYNMIDEYELSVHVFLSETGIDFRDINDNMMEIALFPALQKNYNDMGLNVQYINTLRSDTNTFISSCVSDNSSTPPGYLYQVSSVVRFGDNYVNFSMKTYCENEMPDNIVTAVNSIASSVEFFDIGEQPTQRLSYATDIPASSEHSTHSYSEDGGTITFELRQGWERDTFNVDPTGNDAKWTYKAGKTLVVMTLMVQDVWDTYTLMEKLQSEVVSRSDCDLDPSRSMFADFMEATEWGDYYQTIDSTQIQTNGIWYHSQTLKPGEYFGSSMAGLDVYTFETVQNGFRYTIFFSSSSVQEKEMIDAILETVTYIYAEQ